MREGTEKREEHEGVGGRTHTGCEGGVELWEVMPQWLKFSGVN